MIFNEHLLDETELRVLLEAFGQGHRRLPKIGQDSVGGIGHITFPGPQCSPFQIDLAKQEFSDVLSEKNTWSAAAVAGTAPAWAGTIRAVCHVVYQGTPTIM
jgi:hypothetical protein